MLHSLTIFMALYWICSSMYVHVSPVTRSPSLGTGPRHRWSPLPQGQLMAYGHLGVHLDPKGLSGVMPVAVYGATPAQRQHLSSPLLDIMRILSHFSSLFRSPWMAAQLWCTSHSSQFHIICKCADTAAQSTRFINNEVKQLWPQYQPLGHQ